MPYSYNHHECRKCGRRAKCYYFDLSPGEIVLYVLACEHCHHIEYSEQSVIDADDGHTACPWCHYGIERHSIAHGIWIEHYSFRDTFIKPREERENKGDPPAEPRRKRWGRD